MKLIKILIFFIVFSISIFSILAESDFGYNYLEAGENLNPSINYSKIEVNSSNYTDIWQTNVGNLDNVNSTQFENNGGTLNMITSWLQGFINSQNSVAWNNLY